MFKVDNMIFLFSKDVTYREFQFLIGFNKKQTVMFVKGKQTFMRKNYIRRNISLIDRFLSNAPNTI